MKLQDYLGKKVRISDEDGNLVGKVISFTNKYDTDEELYDEIMIETAEDPYISFAENEIKSIEVIK